MLSKGVQWLKNPPLALFFRRAKQQLTPRLNNSILFTSISARITSDLLQESVVENESLPSSRRLNQFYILQQLSLITSWGSFLQNSVTHCRRKWEAHIERLAAIEAESTTSLANTASWICPQACHRKQMANEREHKESWWAVLIFWRDSPGRRLANETSQMCKSQAWWHRTKTSQNNLKEAYHWLVDLLPKPRKVFVGENVHDEWIQLIINLADHDLFF